MPCHTRERDAQNLHVNVATDIEGSTSSQPVEFSFKLDPHQTLQVSKRVCVSGS